MMMFPEKMLGCQNYVQKFYFSTILLQKCGKMDNDECPIAFPDESSITVSSSSSSSSNNNNNNNNNGSTSPVDSFGPHRKYGYFGDRVNSKEFRVHSLLKEAADSCCRQR